MTTKTKKRIKCKNSSKTCMCKEHIRPDEKRTVWDKAGEAIAVTLGLSFCISMVLLFIYLVSGGEHGWNVFITTFISLYTIITIVFANCDCDCKTKDRRKNINLKVFGLSLSAILGIAGIFLFIGLNVAMDFGLAVLILIFLLMEILVIVDKKRPLPHENTFWFTVARKAELLLYSMIVVPVTGIIVGIVRVIISIWDYYELNGSKILEFLLGFGKILLILSLILLGLYVFIKINEIKYKN